MTSYQSQRKKYHLILNLHLVREQNEMPKSTKTQKSRIGEITLRLVQKD
jgi:hypothetical protein